MVNAVKKKKMNKAKGWKVLEMGGGFGVVRKSSREDDNSAKI